MTENIPASESARRSRRLWLTVGEVVAVAGLALAGMNYWDNHRERTTAEQERSQAQAQQKAEAEKASVFVMRGAADKDGARVLLEPLKGEQAIQTQRYLFPTPVLDHAMEINAGRPQIDLAWFDRGLRGQLKAARKAGADLPEGETYLPVGVVTTYIEAGETRTDRSLYRVGYAATSGLIGGLRLHLQGVSLVRRGVGMDLQKAVDQQWRADAPAPP